MGVVQLAEHWIVVPGVVGSSPITHPRQRRGSGLSRSPLSFHIGASPSGKARDFDSLIRWFESSRPSHALFRRRRCHKIPDPVAQSAEQLPFKQWVRGSNPRRVTTSEQAAYRLLRLFSKVRVRSFRCSSSPNRSRFAGLRFGFHDLSKFHIACSDFFCSAPKVRV